MTHRFLRVPLPITIFVIAYMLVFGFFALRQGNLEFLIYTMVMVGFIAIVLLLHWRVRFSALALTLLAIWGGLHMGGGVVPIPAALADTESTNPVLYSLRLIEWLPRYDQITHAFGFFSACIACGEFIVRTFTQRDPPRLALGVAAALAAMGLGAINEVLEFGVTRVLPEHNVGGYVNTGWDLVSNTVGACFGGLVTMMRSWRRDY